MIAKAYRRICGSFSPTMPSTFSIKYRQMTNRMKATITKIIVLFNSIAFSVFVLGCFSLS